jgi:hypothetical protein
MSGRGTSSDWQFMASFGRRAIFGGLQLDAMKPTFEWNAALEMAKSTYCVEKVGEQHPIAAVTAKTNLPDKKFHRL